MAEKDEGWFDNIKKSYNDKKNAMKEFWKKHTSDDEKLDYESYPFPNIAFYSNDIQFYPYGEKIEYILENWLGNYRLLETNHSYIQWLFPNRKPGMNRQASILTDTDVEAFSSSTELRERVKRAFKMMLDLYGMRLTLDDQFELADNWEERLKALNHRYNHNYLRITRILQALKELGHRQLMLPWMKFLAGLIYEVKVLNHAASSFEKYWIDTLDTEDSIELDRHLEQVRSIESTETENGSTTPNIMDETEIDDILPRTYNTTPHDTEDTFPTTNSTTTTSTPNITHESKAETILPTTTSTPNITHESKAETILPTTTSTPNITHESKAETILPTTDNTTT